jgi:hypothetical protein
MEGQQNGLPILVFDAIYGSKGGQPFTAVVCRTEQNPFQTVGAGDRVLQFDRCTFAYGVKFLGFSWTMSTRRVAEYIDNLRTG